MIFRRIDRGKLAFFSPDGLKYTFKAMSFGPTNDLDFYSAMMKIMKDEWDILFIARLRELSSIRGEVITLNATMAIYIGNKKIVADTRILINNILLWNSNVYALFVYLKRICKVFRKYWVSFRQDKFDFLKSQVEYSGHDTTNDDNCPASSKFSIINDWKTPE